MKKISSFFILVIVTLSVKAQFLENKFYRYNIDLGLAYGLTTANVGGIYNNDNTFIPSIGLNYRINKNISTGLYFDFCEFDRTYTFWIDENTLYFGGFKQQLFSAMVASDYSYYLNPKTSLFGGVGIGLAHNRFDTDIFVDGMIIDESKIKFVIMPSIGILFGKHLKFMIGYKYQDNVNSFVYGGFAFTFGIKKF